MDDIEAARRERRHGARLVRAHRRDVYCVDGARFFAPSREPSQLLVAARARLRGTSGAGGNARKLVDLVALRAADYHRRMPAGFRRMAGHETVSIPGALTLIHISDPGS